MRRFRQALTRSTGSETHSVRRAESGERVLCCASLVRVSGTTVTHKPTEALGYLTEMFNRHPYGETSARPDGRGNAPFGVPRPRNNLAHILES